MVCPAVPESVAFLSVPETTCPVSVTFLSVIRILLHIEAIRICIGLSGMHPDWQLFFLSIPGMHRKTAGHCFNR